MIMIKRTHLSKFLTTIIISIIIGCNGKVNKINEDSEKDKADQFVNHFYEDLEENNYIKDKKIFSKTFFNSVDTIKFDSAFNSYKEKLGNYKHREIFKWTTERSAINDEWFVSLIYIVEYEKSKAFEQFDLIKENDSIKIENYIINSKALSE